MKNIKIILTSKPNFKGYSIESGRADNIKHFDHHGRFENYPSPCNNDNIKSIPEDDIIIEITHMDADTYCGILRLLDKKLPNINLDLLEQLDNNGSSVCKDKYNITLCYMVGIGQLQRNIGFPRVTDERIDVTEIIKNIMLYSDKEIIKLGKETQEKSEQAYRDCLVQKLDNKALFIIDKNDALDPSRPYEDNIDIVIVYRKHYKTISIYCNPKSGYTFAGKIIADIEFNGHPKACGSPRGIQMTEKQAKDVFLAIK